MNNFKSNLATQKPNRSDLGLDLFAEKQVAFDTQVYTSTYTRFWIDEGVLGTSYYRPLLQALFNATEGDTVELIIDTGGGYLSGALSIIQAIQGTEANVVGVLLGDASSAGSLILLACPSIIVMPYGTLMIHQGSHGAWGKVEEVQSRIDFSRTQMSILFDDIYGGFCTEEELVKIKAGMDLYLTSQEVVDRLELKAEFMQAKAEAELAEAELEMEQAELALQEALAEEEAEVAKASQPKRKRRAAAKRTRSTT